MKISRGVAQLVAHSLWERGVVSSSLTTPTIFFAYAFFKGLWQTRLCARSSVG